MPRKNNSDFNTDLKGAARNGSSSSNDLSNFEKDLERLTSIVDLLEQGSVGLDDMLKLYEQGVSLSHSLDTMLRTAELRVEKLGAVHEEAIPGTQESEESEEFNRLFSE